MAAILLFFLGLIPGLVVAFLLGQVQYMIVRYVEDPVVKKILSVPLPVLTGLVCLWAVFRLGELPWNGYDLLTAAFFTKWGPVAVLAGYGLLGTLIGGRWGRRGGRKR